MLGISKSAIVTVLIAFAAVAIWKYTANVALKVAAAREANIPSGAGPAPLRGKNALVVGATQGIGRAIAVRLAQGGANVTIVGRNADAGAAVVAELNQAGTANGAHAFLQGDMMLMANVRKTAAAFAASHARLDYLVFCQTKATLQGRTPTPAEGIDEKLALNFYSRVLMARELAPLLEAAATATDGGDARVLTVLSAGVHAPYGGFAEDPYLEKGSYGQKAAADTAGFYSDLWIEWAAAESASKRVTYVHAAPGFVATAWGTDMPGPVRGLIRCSQAVAGRAAGDCAELIGQGLLSPALRGGARYIGEFGQEVPKTRLHDAAAVATVRAATWALIDKALAAAPEPEPEPEKATAAATTASATK
jgi:NAD(P)-dependent dehydrogenase (short-subunit alcohol dehydrogenase family)